MTPILGTPEQPEIFIGIAGAIGIDIDAITDELQTALETVGYTSSTIRVSEFLESASSTKKQSTDFFR